MQLPFSFSLDQRTNHSSLSSESLLLHLYPSQNTRNKIPTEVTISPLYRATFSHNALFQGAMMRQILHGAIPTRFTSFSAFDVTLDLHLDKYKMAKQEVIGDNVPVAKVR